MEHSIIDFLLHNDDTHETVKYSEEYKKVSDKRYKIYKELTEILTEEQKEQFEKFVNLEIDEIALSNDAYFRLGVKVGVRLVSECMFDF